MAQVKVLLDNEGKWLEHQRYLEQYLQTPDNHTRFADMYQNGERRFPLDLDALRRENPELVNDLIRAPTKLVKHLQAVLQRMGEQLSDQFDGAQKKGVSAQRKATTYRIAFQGNLGRNFVTPRGLQAQLVNNFVAVQGIVTKMSLVRPKLLKSVHYIEQTKQGTVRTYVDNSDPAEETSLNFTSVVPRKDEQGNPMTMEFGYCEFRDHQTLVIQELPEKTPTGLLPRSIEVIVEDDLVDKAKPGDRIVVQGIYRTFGTSITQGDGSLRASLLGMGVHNCQLDAEENILTPEDVRLIQQISQKENLIEYISKSIAPSIFGHDEIKKAVLLLLLGGSEKNLSTGTHLRGDINILLIGDPSTAKSQMLRYVMSIAPLAITTTGRGSSSVGLTAAVRRDPETNENVLEAGAMVLADGGVVLIDEFDKMNEIDRVAIHEVMEQQTVTIAKAGIHCSLNARCSVLAAANPIYGEYQPDLLPTKNIGLPDSLLSRFDLLFIVEDKKQEEIDRKVAERVTKNHRFRGAQDFQAQQSNQDSYIITQNFSVKQEQGPYVSVNSNLFSNDQKNILSQSFLKKYIAYAKREIKQTVLDEEAIEEITQQWVGLRQDDQANKLTKVLPITIRSLESLIRLASAHAKLRLSNRVTVEDCRVAVNLMKYSLTIVDEEEQQHHMKEEEAQRGAMEEEIAPKASRPKRSTNKKQTGSDQKSDEKIMTEEMQKVKIQDREPPSMKKIRTDDQQKAERVINQQQIASFSITDKQKKQVYKAIAKVQQNSRNDQCDIAAVLEVLKTDFQITDELVLFKALTELEKSGKVHFDLKKSYVQLLG